MEIRALVDLGLLVSRGGLGCQCVGCRRRLRELLGLHDGGAIDILEARREVDHQLLLLLGIPRVTIEHLLHAQLHLVPLGGRHPIEALKEALTEAMTKALLEVIIEAFTRRFLQRRRYRAQDIDEHNSDHRFARRDERALRDMAGKGFNLSGILIWSDLRCGFRMHGTTRPHAASPPTRETHNGVVPSGPTPFKSHPDANT